ncbi:Cytochrome oxidase assembly protein ShyY1 [Noviherbaspirillum humi]|uniref:SURF1-like protein n=1 Tax=Noviherbaspirillum humi TaxID=1688639 RepID=A0A239CI36_9BURK|nr:SURF1 family protein [Noviherbaspirillum humi]SNS19896.1 Cytochrome oxidase assembly protein ShyY1 [Noviherbaspirillum humi]
MPIRFRPSLIPALATVVVVAIGIALGQWQMRRAAEKEAIEGRIAARASAPAVPLDSLPPDPAQAEFRRVEVKGRFERAWPIYLDNRPYRGVPGFYVLMPLKIAGSDLHILVARGWMRRDVADRSRIAPYPTPEGMVDLQGTIRLSAGHVLELGKAQVPQAGAIVQNVDPAALASAAGMRMLPYVLEQTSDTGDGLARDWPRPSAGVDKHLGYAFQWYALAATAFLFFVITGLRRGRKQAERQGQG